MLYLLYGIPTAYLSLVVFVPLYYVARQFKIVSYWTMLAAGLLTCLPAALFYGRPDYMFGRTLLVLTPFGAAAATCFFWIVRRAYAAPNGDSAIQLGNSAVAAGHHMIGKLTSVENGPERNVKLIIAPSELCSDISSPSGTFDPRTVDHYEISGL